MVDFADVLDARDLFFIRAEGFAYPPGENATDTLIAGVHLNATALDLANYTFYPGNRTLSNGSDCYLAFTPHQPAFVHPNASFVNATSCYSSVYAMGPRGFAGIGLAAVYALAIVLSLVCLAKHGALYLRVTGRFYPIGRRWQWYWACFVAACALVSLFSSVDIERFYLQDLPIVLAVFFWYLVCVGTMALVWEAVRHWGSWLERQYIDPNPFVYREDDQRARIEFWLPLWFYFWVWMNFFLVVPRNWNFVRSQNYAQQIQDTAIPNATGARFKAGSFCLVIAWLTMLYSLRHSIHHYHGPHHRRVFGKAVGALPAVPVRLALLIALSAAMIAYQILIAFRWDLSLMVAVGANVPAVMAWGYGPSVLILYVQIVYGLAAPNEDKELLRQRRERGEANNRELGLVQKPAWWRRVRGEHLQSMRDKINRNVQEVGGRRAVGRRVEDATELQVRLEAESSAMNHGPGANDGRQACRDGVTNTDTDTATATSATAAAEERQQNRPSRDGGGRRPRLAHRSNSAASTTPSIHVQQPQQVRSMLDI
ncbi:hypothetical protein E4U41_004097 [Claviceps citrina]|nr:hypothetical protein E4U41_004097 [Claviceps citrina]